MENMLVSVIVPAYNVQPYLERCLNSIFTQTYKNIEVIVVDDGSVDGTASVIQRFKKRYKERMSVFTINNSGVANARMVGVKAARGEWIGFVDGDDEIESDMYETLLKNAITYEADISHCGYRMIFEDGRVRYFYNSKRIFSHSRSEGVKELLEGTQIEPSLCNKLFKRKLLLELMRAGKMNTTVRINEDLLMNYYLFSTACKSVFQDVCKYYYHVRSGSATRVKLNKNRIYDPIKVRKIIVDDIMQELKDEAIKAYIYTCIGSYNALLFDKSGKYTTDSKIVREKIIAEKRNIPLLSRKRKIMAYMIMYVPMFYRLIYRVYSKYVLKSKYD